MTMPMAADYNRPRRRAHAYRSTRPLRERVCGIKARLTEGGAYASAVRARAEGERMSAYPCPFCGYWHIGHAPPMETLEEIAALLRERRA